MAMAVKTMNEQLKGILNKAKLNFAVLGCILIIAVVGKVVAPEITNAIFNAADQLVSELYLIFVAITLGAFIPNYKYVAAGSIGIFIAAAILVHLGVFTYLTTEYLFSVLLVVLGFAAIAIIFHLPLTLGISELNMTLMCLTFFIGALTLVIGRTTRLQGAIHLIIFFEYLFLSLVP